MSVGRTGAVLALPPARCVLCPAPAARIWAVGPVCEVCESKLCPQCGSLAPQFTLDLTPAARRRAGRWLVAPLPRHVRVCEECWIEFVQPREPKSRFIRLCLSRREKELSQ